MPWPPDPIEDGHEDEETIYAETDNAQARAINDIVAELGSDPSGASSTVTDRLDAQDTTIAAKETPAGAQAKADAKVADAINDGTTTVAPSQNAVFDALALKETPAGAQAKADAKVTQTITNGVTTTAPSEDVVFDALALKETPAGAQSKADAKVADAITDGTTTVAPSQNAVFDALALKAPLASRTTFSNANYTVLATDRYVAQVGTMSAARTVTLPAANAVSAGYEITVADESGSVTAANSITVARAGSDTILNPVDLHATTSVAIKSPDARTFRSDGTSKWMVTTAGTRRPYAWWQHNNDVAIPNNVWTPLPWNSPYVGAIAGQVVGADEFGVTPNLQAASTTIAAASNGAVLPQATINVADTSLMTATGYAVITGPPGAGDDTIFSYTGKTGTTFTGCNSAYRGGGVGISTGTLATGQVVRQANVEWTFPTGYLWMLVADVAFDNIATTAYFGVRHRAIDNTFNFPVASQHHGGINITSQHGQVSVQPGAEGTGTPSRIEVIQVTGGVKLSKVDGIQAPSLMQAFMSGR